MKKNKISCIVPAYNEGKRIGNVLRVLSKHELIDELIVINDGSKDDTLSQIKKFSGVNLITYQKNKGKSYAIMLGLKRARNDNIILIDSDLVGLSKQDITDLIKPVLENKADVTISLRVNSLGLYKFLGIDFISGERVFSKKLLGNLENIGKLTGFGFESYMNRFIVEQKKRIAVVNWKKVISPRKSVKMGFFRGTIGDILMIKDIIKTMGFFNMIITLFKMRNLIVR